MSLKDHRVTMWGISIGGGLLLMSRAQKQQQLSAGVDDELDDAFLGNQSRCCMLSPTIWFLE
jgi:hypothetical protein